MQESLVPQRQLHRARARARAVKSAVWGVVVEADVLRAVSGLLHWG